VDVGKEATISKAGFRLRNLHACEQLPDLRRFVRCLPTARYICDNGGWPPDWNPDAAEPNDVADTIRELAAIELENADEHEFVTRTGIAQALVRCQA
jgi:hypothetical protein